MGVFLSGTLGFLLSTGGGGDFSFSSILSRLFRRSAYVLAFVVTLLLELLLVVVDVMIVLPCCLPGSLLRSRFLFSSDLRWAATVPMGRPVSLSISLRESRDPKLSLRPEADAELPLLPVFLI